MDMMDYIRQQSSVLSKALDDRSRITETFRRVFKEEGPDHIYLVASGTSRNAAKAAAPFMEDCLGIEVSVFSATSAKDFFGERPLVIYISQGGNSTNTIAAIERNRDILSIAMTGNPDGMINTMVENYVEIPCGEETVGPKTKGYTTTVLQLYLFALEAAVECGIRSESYHDDVIGDLKRMVVAMDSNVEASDEWVTRNSGRLQVMKTAYVVGKGVDASVADEGALKIMETLLIPAVGFECEEYLHGPSCSVADMTAGIYMMPPASDSKDLPRFETLVKYHRCACDQTFTFSGTKSRDERDLWLTLSDNLYMRPFEYIIPIQILSARIPSLKGVEGLGHDRFKVLDGLVKTKARHD